LLYVLKSKMNLKHLIKRLVFHITNNFKPLTVHTEAIFIDGVWEKIKEKALKKEVHTWYVITPANYELSKVLFNIKKSKKEVSDIMEERYKWLLKHNQKLELHIHLNKIMNITYKEQEKLFRESLEWMKKKLGIRPKEFVSGWWAYNRDTIKILRKQGLKLIKENQYKATHDYNWVI